MLDENIVYSLIANITFIINKVLFNFIQSKMSNNKYQLINSFFIKVEKAI